MIEKQPVSTAKTLSTPEKKSLYSRMQEAARETLGRFNADDRPFAKPSVSMFPSKDALGNTVTSSFLWQGKAEFLPDTVSFFHRCGIDATLVNPVPMGEGLNHVVFEYMSKEGGKKVIKVPRESTKGMMNNGTHDERENITLVMKYFPDFAVPTQIKIDPDTKNYIVVQDAVEGTPVTNKSQTNEIDMQLQEIMKANRLLMKETGFSMDFVGLTGVMGWAKHQFKQFFTRKSVFEVSNLLVDAKGNIRIIDYDMLRLNNVSLYQGLVARAGFGINYYLMKWYFGVDMKG